ncbi:MAG: hypothetical protein L6Q68_14490 [Aquabacterium sp.]|jgi:hypothetical protein|nr:hypothetical protein [Aquabacterium sp.]
MALSAEEQGHLRAILLLFFPESRADFESAELNERTLDLTERFLVEVDRCSRTLQKFLADVAGGLTRGFLRRALRKLGQDAVRRDGYLIGTIACTNQGKALYKRPILESVIA